MSRQIFDILSPEIYNALYAEKFYDDECHYISTFTSQISPRYTRGSFRRCIELGAGTGNLTERLIASYDAYLAIEPSESFCCFLKDRFSRYGEAFSVYEDRLEESVGVIGDFACGEEPVLCIANFNVVNYLRQESFLDFTQRLGSALPPDSLLIFDTWSLEFVKKQPSVMTSRREFTISSDEAGKRSRVIRRDSSSRFSNSNESVNIEFVFSEKVNDLDDPRHIGNELHRVYPFSIKGLEMYFHMSDWTLVDVRPYSSIRSFESLSVTPTELDCGTERNWYFAISRK